MIKVIDYVKGYGRQVVFEAERSEEYARNVAFGILRKSNSAVIEIDGSEDKFWDGRWYMEAGNPFPVHEEVK